ncbi:MAG: hypothetical protein MAG581_01833 [Deltaproteobacteria bacterium]|nr:hypothetical protein [Deltaproteobacteria bacterium]
MTSFRQLNGILLITEIIHNLKGHSFLQEE